MSRGLCIALSNRIADSIGGMAAELVTQVQTPQLSDAEQALMAQYEASQKEQREFEAHAFDDAPKSKTPTEIPEPPRPRDDAGRFVKPAETPETPKHSPRLLRIATDIGIPEAEANGMSGEALESAIHTAQRFLLEERSQRVIKQPEPDSFTKPAIEPVSEIDWGKDEDGNPFTEKNYGEPVARAIKSAHQFEALEKRLAAVEAFQRQAAQGRLLSRMDKLFNEHEGIYGKGPTGSLDPSGAEYARRQSLFAHLNMLAQGKKQTTPEADFAKIHGLLFASFSPAKPAEKPAHEPSKNGHANRVSEFTPEEWNEGGLSKPTHRQPAPEPKGLAAAKKTFVRGMREAGLDEASALGVTDENDELPE